MNSIKKLSVFAILFLTFGLTSCSDVEPLDPAVIVTPTNPSNPSNPTTPGVSTGDYWPTALNNSWTFKDDGVIQPPVKIVSINSIGSDTYYTFNQALGGSSNAFGNAITRLKKVGGSYYYKLEDIVVSPINGVPGLTVTGSEQIILKDNVAVGATWNGSYTQTITYTDPQFPTISTPFSYVGSIVEKDVSLVVLGETFTNVIKVKMVQTSTGDLAGTQTSFYWFAKDVGPIKYTIEDEEELSNADLVEYTIN